MSRPSDGGTGRLGLAMLLGMWVVVLVMLTLVFTGVLERRAQPPPLQVQSLKDGSREVRMRASRGGQYLADGFINDHPVRFLLDTGASDVSVPVDLAERIGLRRGPAATYVTANGRIVAYRTRLDEVRLGSIRLAGVAGSINPAAVGQEVLLGMSFLESLEIRQRDGILTLVQAAP